MKDVGEPDLDQPALGARLRELREARGLHQVQVAAQMGMARNSVWQIESGARRVDSLELRRFAMLYRCSVNYLLCLQDPAESVPAALGRVLNDLPTREQDQVLRFAQFLQQSREQPPELRLVDRAHSDQSDWAWHESRRRRRNARC